MRRLLLFSFLTLVITGAYLNYLADYQGYIMGTAIVTIDKSKPFMTSQFSTGITHTQDDIELSGGSAAKAATSLIQSSMTYQNAFIMGWGTDDPEPSPGQYDWDSLDSYVKLMTATGGTPFISFCCAPGWMRPDGFSDDWQYIETAPAPSHDADFATLAATVELLQGARLTAWEAQRAGLPHAVLADGAAGSLMAAGQVDLVIIGADRIAADGSVANKVGSYSLAVLARHHGVPFVVAAPVSTIDLTTPGGAAITVEQRPAGEVTSLAGRPVAPAGSPAFNPAFDVTPPELITALVTERGVTRPVNAAALRALAGGRTGLQVP
jgi:hypothetical protein